MEIPSKIDIKKRRLSPGKVEYSDMDKNDLILEVERLNKHVKQLKILLDKANSEVNINSKIQKSRREFDFSKYNKRHILLKFAYLGWNYQGYITQEGTNETVEDHLFNALIKTKLIENRQNSNYHRCGRTDKGVSAFCQVISIDCRSNCSSGVGIIENPNSKVKESDISNEINYVKLLNGVLPDEIRVLYWCPIEKNISSRFDCDGRSYRYYFPKGDLDIDKMFEAGKKLIGEHDFRNFCKMDVGNGVVTFVRRIDKVSLNILDKEPNLYSIVEMIIEGSSFLWHQIRSIMAILFLIGQGKEDPCIVNDLLDINNWPCKPQYNIASELPLVLFDSYYENINWLCKKSDLEKIIKHFQDIWLVHQCKTIVVKRMIDYLEHDYEKTETIEPKIGQNSEDDNYDNLRTMYQPYSFLQGKTISLKYIKLENRKTAKSFENRVDFYIKKKKINKELVEEKLAFSKNFHNKK